MKVPEESVGDVPPERVRRANSAEPRPDADFVLYWMTAARRTRSNFGLQRAAGWASALRRPLVVLEALRCGDRWASPRTHRFVIAGMRDQERSFRDRPVHYHPYVEPSPGAGKGLVEALARRACVVVTDEYPCYFLPRMVAAVAKRLEVAFEVVDGGGLLPLSVPGRSFSTAFSFRAFLQKELRPHLSASPAPDPLARLRLPRLAEWPEAIERRWPRAALERPDDDPALLPAGLTTSVAPVSMAGGARAAASRLAHFVEHGLPHYAEHRSDVEREVASGLSPYLHFGHVGVHEVLAAVGAAREWSVDDVSERSNGGKREGWWGADAATESFLDELVTWRELGAVYCHQHPRDYDRFETLPEWALATLAEHGGDPRRPVYTLAQLDGALTHDPLWNAAQRELVREGRMHNYLRMLWGKKVLEWSATPKEAFETLIELNNRYALDGRDPNSYSGIAWTFGRFDRAWGPVRPIFGTVRYMSSDSTRRKLDVKGYLAKYGSPTLFDGEPDPPVTHSPRARRSGSRTSRR